MVAREAPLGKRDFKLSTLLTLSKAQVLYLCFFIGAKMSNIKDPAKKKAVLDRLSRIEGQIRGVQKLINSDADCEKIAQQMAAARKALDKAFFSMVGCMLEESEHPVEHVTEMLVKFG